MPVTTVLALTVPPGTVPDTNSDIIVGPIADRLNLNWNTHIACGARLCPAVQPPVTTSGGNAADEPAVVKARLLTVVVDGAVELERLVKRDAGIAVDGSGGETEIVAVASPSRCTGK